MTVRKAPYLVMFSFCCMSYAEHKLQPVPDPGFEKYNGTEQKSDRPTADIADLASLSNEALLAHLDKAILEDARQMGNDINETHEVIKQHARQAHENFRTYSDEVQRRMSIRMIRGALTPQFKRRLTELQSHILGGNSATGPNIIGWNQLLYGNQANLF